MPRTKGVYLLCKVSEKVQDCDVVQYFYHLGARHFLPSTLPGKATECPQYMEEGCFDKRFYVPLHFGNARKL